MKESKLAERLKKLRQDKGLSQVQLAVELDMGAGFIANIELGTKSVSIKKLMEIADYFVVTPNYLLGYDEE